MINRDSFKSFTEAVAFYKIFILKNLHSLLKDLSKRGHINDTLSKKPCFTQFSTIIY